MNKTFLMVIVTALGTITTIDAAQPKAAVAKDDKDVKAIANVKSINPLLALINANSEKFITFVGIKYPNLFDDFNKYLHPQEPPTYAPPAPAPVQQHAFNTLSSEKNNKRARVAELAQTAKVHTNPQELPITVYIRSTSGSFYPIQVYPSDRADTIFKQMKASKYGLGDTTRLLHKAADVQTDLSINDNEIVKNAIICPVDNR